MSPGFHRVRRLVVVVLSIIVFAWISVSDPYPRATAQVDRESTYSLSDTNRHPSRLRAQKIVVLHAEVNGMIRAIRARRQDFVSEGQPLIEFDKELIELQIERIEAQLQLGTAKEEARISLEYAREVFEIVDKLFNTAIGDSRASSLKEHKEARQRLDIALLGERKAELEIQTLQNELAQNQILLQKHTISAPMDGVIVPFSSVLQLKDQQLKSAEVGEMIPAGGVVLAMMKVDRLRASQWLSYKRLEDVRLGQEAKVYILGTDEPVPAKVVYISPTIEELGDQFTVEVEIENPQIDWQSLPEGSYRYKFRPAMRARVEI